MGLQALVPFSVIKEICGGNIKRNKKKFTGKVGLKRERDNASDSKEKVEKIRRVLLSAKHKKENKNSSKKDGKSSDQKSSEQIVESTSSVANSDSESDTSTFSSLISRSESSESDSDTTNSAGS